MFPKVGKSKFLLAVGSEMSARSCSTESTNIVYTPNTRSASAYTTMSPTQRLVDSVTSLPAFVMTVPFGTGPHREVLFA